MWSIYLHKFKAINTNINLAVKMHIIGSNMNRNKWLKAQPTVYRLMNGVYCGNSGY